MADKRKERSFPEIPGVPSRSELMKPLIFPNSQRGFKIFTYVVTVGEYILLQGTRIRIHALAFTLFLMGPDVSGLMCAAYHVRGQFVSFFISVYKVKA